MPGPPVVPPPALNDLLQRLINNNSELADVRTCVLSWKEKTFDETLLNARRKITTTKNASLLVAS